MADTTFPHPPPKRPLTWLITGSSSGFGLELARTAQANGHHVIATSRNPSRTPELVSEIESRGGQWRRLDVDDPDSAAVVDTLEGSGTAIDVLVNCAGFGLYGASEHFAEAEVRRQFETLFFGSYRLMRAAAPHMRRRRFGVVANVSSAAALCPVPSMGVYGAAKAAQDSVSETLARELNPFNVRVVSVNPSVFDTNMPRTLQYQEAPLHADYAGQPVDMLMRVMRAGNHRPEGDVAKAVKAIYEFVVCEGIGQGREREQHLPLGRAGAKAAAAVSEQWAHCLEVFGDVAVGADYDREEQGGAEK